MPTFVAFKGGEEVKKLVGPRPNQLEVRPPLDVDAIEVAHRSFKEFVKSLSGL